MVLEPIGSQINELFSYIITYVFITRSHQGRVENRVKVGSGRSLGSVRVGRFKVGSDRSRFGSVRDRFKVGPPHHPFFLVMASWLML